MKMRCLLAVLMMGVASLGQGLKLENGKFSENVAVSVRCGTIVQIKLTNVPVSILDLDTLLEAGKFDPDESYQQALTSRTPAKGNIFLILTCEVNEGFSIGRYDYVLVIDNQQVPIEAIRMPGQPFDPRVWELKAENGVNTVHMLFEIPLPSAPMTARLQPNLDSTISYGGVELAIGGGKGEAPSEPQSQDKSPAGPAADSAPAETKDSKPATAGVFEMPTKKTGEAKTASPAKKPPQKKPGKKPGKKPAGKNGSKNVLDLF